jgi:hypothetical protein
MPRKCLWSVLDLVVPPVAAAVALWCAYEFPHSGYAAGVVLLPALAALLAGGVFVAHGLVTASRAQAVLVLILWGLASLFAVQWIGAWMAWGSQLHAICHGDSSQGCESRELERFCRTVHDCPSPVPAQPELRGVDTPPCTPAQLASRYRRNYCGVGPSWLDIAIDTEVFADGGFTSRACRL